MKSDNCGCGRPQPQSHPDADRYVTFSNIDCDGNARRLMDIIVGLKAGPAADNPFLAYFLKKRSPPSGPAPDDLFLIHSNINQIRDLLDEYAERDAVLLLQQIEEECC